MKDERAPVRLAASLVAVAVGTVWAVLPRAFVLLLIWANVSSGFSCPLDQDGVFRDYEQALMMYAAKHRGEYPQTEGELGAIRRYLPDGRMPRDVWGRRVWYLALGDGFLLMSLGPDGVFGGEPSDDRLWWSPAKDRTERRSGWVPLGE
jgi:hypothetical protein